METSSIALEISSGCFAARSRRLARAVTRIYDDHLRPVGIKVSQLTVLVAVAGGTTRPVDIGSLLDMEKSTVTRALQLLESNGWIARSTSVTPHEISLTAAGAALLEAAIGPWRSATADIEARLSPATEIPTLAPAATTDT